MWQLNARNSVVSLSFPRARESSFSTYYWITLRLCSIGPVLMAEGRVVSLSNHGSQLCYGRNGILTEEEMMLRGDENECH